MDAVTMIALERERQISEELRKPDGDDLHTDHQLARAAACYAQPGYCRTFGLRGAPVEWPWHADWWKPTPHDRIRELVKAGALIVAEIERLQRANPAARS